VKHAALLLPVAVSLVLAGCGADQHSETGKSDQELARLGLTRELPTPVVEACRKIQPRVTVTVYCPPVVPRSIPPPPHIEQAAGPLPIAYSGGRVTRYTSDYFEVNVESGSWLDHLSDGHWIFAAGSPGVVRRRINALPLLGPPATRVVGRAVLTSRNIRVAGVLASVKRMARYPQGGISGGHVLVLWRMGNVDYLISIHGYGNEGRAVAMADGLIREIRDCPHAQGPVISGCG
jgi:hypothetical protein